MRKFRIWLLVDKCSAENQEITIELPNDLSDEEIEEACQDAFDSLVGNLDGGWEEFE